MDQKAIGKAILVPGDLSHAEQRRTVIDRPSRLSVRSYPGQHNAAHQITFKTLEEISHEEWEKTFVTNIHAMFYLAMAAVRAWLKGGCTSARSYTATLHATRRDVLAVVS